MLQNPRMSTVERLLAAKACSVWMLLVCETSSDKIHAAVRTLKAENVLYKDVEIGMEHTDRVVAEEDKNNEDLKEPDHNGTLVNEPDDTVGSVGLRTFLQGKLPSTRKVHVVELQMSN